MTTLASTTGPRGCNPEELAEMIDLANSVMRQGSSQSFLTDYPLVYTAENLPNVQIIKTDDVIVSVVPFLPKEIVYAGTRFRIGIISPTATHPEHRRLGHARRCLDACLALMEADGIELSVLWTLPTTFPFYEQAGFQGIPSQSDLLSCTRKDARIFPHRGHSISILDPSQSSHLQAVEVLQDRRFCGVMRSGRDARALFSLPKTTTYLAYDDAGKTSGYLLYCTGSHKPGILEADGSPEAIESLIHHLLTTTDAPTTTIYLTKNASALSSLIRARVPSRVQPMEAGPMMVRTNDDPSGFLAAIRPWLEAHHLEEKLRYSLEMADTQQVMGFDYDPHRERRLVLTDERMDHHKVVTRRELTSMIFGSREGAISAMTGGLYQTEFFYFPIPMLDHS